MPRIVATLVLALAAGAFGIASASATESINQSVRITPQLLDGDIAAVRSSQPLFVLSIGRDDTCKDAVIRVLDAAAAAPGIAIAIVNHHDAQYGPGFAVTSAMVLTPGIGDTYIQSGFDACSYGDKLGDFLKARAETSSKLMAANQKLEDLKAQMKPLWKRLAELPASTGGGQGVTGEQAHREIMRQLDALQAKADVPVRAISHLKDQELAEASAHRLGK